MSSFKVFMKNGMILTISSIIIKFISTTFNIFLSNTISSSTLGIWGIIISIFTFLLTIASSRDKLSFY